MTEAAGILLRAESGGSAIAPLTDTWEKLDVTTAYEVQAETLRRRLERGDCVPARRAGP